MPAAHPEDEALPSEPQVAVPAPAANVAPESPVSTLPAPRMRPPGEQGGHTVQDWEQPVRRSRLRTAPPAPASTTTSRSDLGALEDSPEVTPIYLRPAPRGEAADLVAGKAEASPLSKGPLDDAAMARALEHALTEGLTRLVPEAIAAALAAVRASPAARAPAHAEVAQLAAPAAEPKVVVEPSA